MNREKKERKKRGRAGSLCIPDERGVTDVGSEEGNDQLTYLWERSAPISSCTSMAECADC